MTFPCGTFFQSRNIGGAKFFHLYYFKKYWGCYTTPSCSLTPPHSPWIQKDTAAKLLMANASLVKLEKKQIYKEKSAHSAILKPAKGLKCMETKKEVAKTKIVVICT